MKSSWLDRTIGVLFPHAQLNRMRSRAALQVLANYDPFRSVPSSGFAGGSKNYEAGNQSRRTAGWIRPRGDSNATPGAVLARLRDSSRHLVRNSGLAFSAIETITDDAIGRGLKPTAKHEQFEEWAKGDIDADGMCDFPTLQYLIMRTIVESGGVLIRRLHRRPSDGLALPLQLRVLEPDFIDSSQHRGLPDGGKIVRGVEFDQRGRRAAFWLFRDHPGSSIISGSGTSGSFATSSRVPANEIIHMFRIERAGQVRGAPWFAPVLLKFQDFDTLDDATLVKHQIAACLAVLTTDLDGSQAIGTQDPNNEQLDQLQPGMILNMPSGRDIKVVDLRSFESIPSLQSSPSNN